MEKKKPKPKKMPWEEIDGPLGPPQGLTDEELREKERAEWLALPEHERRKRIRDRLNKSDPLAKFRVGRI